MRVNGIAATTDRLAAYGGWKLGREHLEALAVSMQSGDPIWRAKHDSRLPIDVMVLATEVRQRADGEYELFVELDVDRSDWERGGDLRGFSFTLIGTIRQSDPSSPNPSVGLFADADSYDAAAIDRAAQALERTMNVEAGVLFQFSYAPPPSILFLIPWEVVAGIAQDVAAGLIVAAVVELIKARKQRLDTEDPDPPSIVEFRLKDGDREISARVETNDPEAVRAAVEKLPDVDLGARHQSFDPETSRWDATLGGRRAAP